METINKNELRDESVPPDAGVLKELLGESYAAYQKLIQLFDQNGLTHEWRFYHDVNTWLCKVQKKAKTIVWMSAWKGYMQASIYIPEKAIEEVCQLEISEECKEKFKQAKNMGKSKPCIFEVRDMDVLPDFEKVMYFKISIK